MRGKGGEEEVTIQGGDIELGFGGGVGGEEVEAEDVESIGVDVEAVRGRGSEEASCGVEGGDGGRRKGICSRVGRGE